MRVSFQNGRKMLGTALAVSLIFLSMTRLALSADTGRIDGTVVDSADNKPIQGARARAVNSRTGFTQTDDTEADGYFKFSGLPNGAYWVYISKDGYQDPPRRLATVSGGFYHLHTIRITKNPTPTPVRAYYDLKVTTMDQAGSLLGGVSLRLSGGASRTGTTNGDGYCLFDDLPGDKTYTLQASKENYDSELTSFYLSKHLVQELFLEFDEPEPEMLNLPVNLNGEPGDYGDGYLEQGTKSEVWYKMMVPTAGDLTVSLENASNFELRLYRTGLPNPSGLFGGTSTSVSESDLCSSPYYYAHLRTLNSGRVYYKIAADLDNGGSTALDLLPTLVTSNDREYGAGDPILLHYQLQNIGRSNAGTFSIGFYASTDSNPSISGGDINLGETSISGGLVPGDSESGSASFPSTSLNTSTNYYAKIRVDEDSQWSGEIACNNVLASDETFSIAETSGKTTRTLHRLKIEGYFDDAGMPNSYEIDTGGTTKINDFILAPPGVTIYPDLSGHPPGSSSDPRVEYGSEIFRLQPSGLADAVNDTWDLLDLPLITLDAETGLVEELPYDLILPPALVFRLNSLEVHPYYSKNGMSGSLKYALPLSVRAKSEQVWVMTNAVNRKLDLFDPRRMGWTYLNASANFKQSCFTADFFIDSEPTFGHALVIRSASGHLDACQGTFTMSGSVALKMMFGNHTEIRLNKLEFVDFYKLNSINIEATGNIPVIPSPVQIPGVLNLYIFGFDKFAIIKENIVAEREEDLKMFGRGLGVYLGCATNTFLGVAVKIVHVDGTGWVKPSIGDFHVKGGIKLFICAVPVSFEGFDLSGEFDYDWSRKKGTGEAHFVLDAKRSIPLIFEGDGDLEFDSDGNYFSAFAEGSLITFPNTGLFGGFEIGYARITVDHDTAYGIAEFIFCPGVGFRFNPDGTAKVGTNLYKKYASQGVSGNASKLRTIVHEPVFVPSNQPYAIIRLTYASGEATTSLQDPNLVIYDQDNSPIQPDNEGPVFYRSNPDVEEQEQPLNEICYYLIPEASHENVLSGTYTLNINDSGIGDYQVQLWLANTPPSMTLTEPSNSLDNPSNVLIEWTDDDPDNDAEILLFYDRDNEGYNGQLITVASATDGFGPEPVMEDIDGASGSFTWQIDDIPTGDYYIYAMISDGSNIPVYSNYSSGRVRIVHPLAPAAPTNLSAAAGNSAIHCEWSHSATEGVQFVLMYDRNVGCSTATFENTLAVEDLTEWTIEGLTNGHEYRVAVAAIDEASGYRSPLAGPIRVFLFTRMGNNAPTIRSAPVEQARVGYLYEYQVEAFDPDGDALTYELIKSPMGMLIDSLSGLITFNPVGGHLGSHRVEILVRDSKSGMDTQEYYLLVDDWKTLNEDPKIITVPVISALIGELYEYTPLAQDPDGHSVSLRLTQAPVEMEMEVGTNRITWIPERSNFGSYPVEILASDGIGGESTQSFTVTVGYAPLIADFTLTPATGTAPLLVSFKDQSKGIFDRYEWDFGNGGGPDSELQHPSHTFANKGLVVSSSEVTLTIIRDPLGEDLMGASASTSHIVDVSPEPPIADFDFSPRSGFSPLVVSCTDRSQNGVDSWSWTFPAEATPTGTTDPVVSATFDNGNIRQDLPVVLTVSNMSGADSATKMVSLMRDTTDLVFLFEDDFLDSLDGDGWEKINTGDLPETVSPNFGSSPDAATITNSATGLAIIRTPPISMCGSDFDVTIHTVGQATGSRQVIIRDANSGNYYRIESYSGISDEWDMTDSMLTERLGYWPLITLPSGKVLVVGGSTTNTELYDPNKGSWSPAASASTAFNTPQAVLLHSGKVLVCGGMVGDYPTNRCEVYNPDDDIWQSAKPMNSARSLHGLVVLSDGRVLAAGGLGSGGTPSPIASCEIFDPTASSWLPTGSLNTSRALWLPSNIVLLDNGRVLFAGGGYEYTPPPDPVPISFASCEIYDPTTGRWSYTAQPMNLARHGDYAIQKLQSGKVLVAGGIAYRGASAYDHCELFDPVTGVWEEITPMNTQRADHGSVLLFTGEVLVVGGRRDLLDYTTSCEIFHPDTKRWTNTASLNHLRGDAGKQIMLATLPSGRVLTAGADSTNRSCEVFEYDHGIRIIENSGGVLTTIAEIPATLVEDSTLAFVVRGGTEYKLLIDNVLFEEWDGLDLGRTVEIGIGVGYDAYASLGQASYDYVSLVGPNCPPQVGDIPDIIVEQGGSDQSIDLDDYVSDDSTAPDAILWKVNSATEGLWTTGTGVTCRIDPEDHRVTFIAAEGFSGARVFTFIAEDEQGKVDSDDMMVMVPKTESYYFTDITHNAGVTDAVSGSGVAFADYDRDYRLDIAVSQDAAAPNRLLHNQGNRIFRDVASDARLDSASDSRTAIYGDVDNDSNPDLFVANAGCGCQLFLNNGNGTFTDVSDASGVSLIVGTSYGAAFTDFDLDGDLDVYVAYSDRPNVMFENRGATFVDVAGTLGIASTADTRGVAFGDYDRDGDSDLYLAIWGGSNLLYRNMFVESGTAGFAFASTYTPGARSSAVSWIDSLGTMWLFGGSGYDRAGNFGRLNNLSKYDAAKEDWIWAKGALTVDQIGIYGTQGEDDPDNTPGGRSSPVSWTDSSGGLWLFGGYGRDGAGSLGSLNDLWKYDPETGNWTWIKGALTQGQLGNYATQGVPGVDNTPGARSLSVSWTDSAGALWLFGGNGYDGEGTVGWLNDLWKYETGNWTWIKGASTANQIGRYGARGVPGSDNTPGGRINAVKWTDGSDTLWLFGGYGYGAASYGQLNDLWKYEMGNWTWIKGASTANQIGFYGTQGEDDPDNTPGARSSAVTWIDNLGRLWLFGGTGYDGEGNPGVSLNDLWKYEPAMGNWTWIKGASTANQIGFYGTQGEDDPDNTPGARFSAVSWIDDSGALWLFGGHGRDSAGNYGKLNDLWKYEPATGYWTWINGASVANQISIAEVGGGLYSRGAAWGDFNNDTWLDVYVTNGGTGDERDNLYLNLGNGTFEDVAAAWHCDNALDAYGVTLGDYDNDGWLDVFVTNNDHTNILYRNVAGSGFTDVTTPAGVLGAADHASRGAAFGEIDNDGDVDLYVVNSDGQSDILYRNNGNDNHWLQIDLVGIVSNRDGIGARVEVASGTMTQIREVNGGSGYCSQDSLRVEFGLGKEEIIKELYIYWPSGIVMRRAYVASNQVLAITEALELEGIYLEPCQITLRPGETANFKVYGYYLDNATQELDPTQIFWETLNPLVATIVSEGEILALRGGQTQLVASFDEVISPPADIRVSALQVTALNISPSAAKLSIGERLPFTAVAQYNDGTGADMTASANWFSDNLAIAQIGIGGLLKALAIGTTTVLAEYDGVLSNEATVEVTGIGSTSLEVLPTSLNLDLGIGPLVGQFNAWKHFNDGSGDPPLNITDWVTWITDDPFVAGVDSTGKAIASRVGNTHVRAQHGTTESNAATISVLYSVPEINVVPSSLDFGIWEIDAGPTTILTVTIRNEGVAPLNFTGGGITLIGSTPSEFAIANSPSTSPLSPGNARAVDIQFDPSSTGPKSANLSISTDDPDEPLVLVGLSGQGRNRTFSTNWESYR